MTGILAIWNNRAPDSAAAYERWYNGEHLPERVAVPGFRSGRRYEALSAALQYFTFYEVDSPAVLSSPAYLARLESPTEATRAIMPSLQMMTRTVCEVVAAAGHLTGSHAVTVRFGDPLARRFDAGSFAARLAARDEVARVRLWTAAAAQTPQDTREMRSRGAPDGAIGSALMIECFRADGARHIARSLVSDGILEQAGFDASAPVDVYSLLCIHEN
jgi:hypothetical protein